MKQKLLFAALLLITSAGLFAQGTTTCAAAYVLTANGTYTTGTINGTYPTTTCFGDASASPNARWFSFTPTQSGIITVSSDIAANVAATDTRVSIFTGTCAALTCQAGNDDVSGTNYKSKIDNFVVASGTTYYIVWDDRWENTSRSFDFTFVAQSCFSPTNFVFTTPPTTTTADIGWTAPAAGTPVGYQFEYGVRGFTQGTGTTLNPATTNVSLSPLTPSTVYDFYVRTDCGAGNYSVWTGPITFNTVFQAVNPPYTTGIEDTNLDYIGWTAPTAAVGTEWELGAYGSPIVYEGNSAIAGISDDTDVSDAFAISRGINLVGGQQAVISFWIRNFRATGNTTSTGSFQVTSGTAQTEAGQTNVLATETGLSNDTYTQRTYNYTPPSTGVYYFGLRNQSPINSTGFTHAIVVDLFSVTQVLSTSDFVSSKLSVYPNPVNNVVTVFNTGTVQMNKIDITDINGRVVKTATFAGVSEAQLNISDLNTGIYFMNIDTNEGSATKKIIKN